MKHLKLISLLSILFAFNIAQAETTHGGEIWADFDHVLDNGQTGTNDVVTGMGVEINRARLSLGHEFNSDWSANVKVEAAGTVSLVRANIVGKNWIADGNTFVFGKQNNAYRAAYDGFHNQWLHRDLASDLSGLLTTGYTLGGLANLSNFSGISVHQQINDMWKAALTVNSGYNDQINDSGNNGTNSDVVGYGLMVEGWFTKEFGLLLGHEMFGTSRSDNVEGDDDENGFSTTRATLIYKNDMLKASFEYAMFSHDAASGTELEDTSAMALSLDYMMGENFVHLYYLTTSDFDATGFGADLDSEYTVGYNWGLAENLNTGVYYTATTRDADDSDESAIEWKWAANF